MDKKNLPTNKHFLDTSVLRPIISGTSKYKEYFKSKFGDDPCYISNYVQMEFKRSYIMSLIVFYNILDLPTIPTIGEAFAFSSNSFEKSELKADLQIANLLATYKLDWSEPRDKIKALEILAAYVKRLDIKLRRQFKNIGQNSMRCTRANVQLDIKLENSRSDLKKFVNTFDDKKTCRSKCSIDKFLLNIYQTEVSKYITESKQLSRNTDNLGFIKIAENLEKALLEKAKVCTCDFCERIGDAVIALDAPRTMQLEHTDKSFNHLCKSINQPHQKHPSETEIINPKSTTNKNQDEN
ncbi:MAG: hypothetical protein WAQ98_08810 [Blastocatellia bacterium]